MLLLADALSSMYKSNLLPIFSITFSVKLSLIAFEGGFIGAYQALISVSFCGIICSTDNALPTGFRD